MPRTPKTKAAAPSTRDHVLEVCRKLFNAKSPSAVTTAEIAAEAGINEGNLYYYFKKKEAILVALFDLFEADVIPVAGSAGVDLSLPDPYTEYQRSWFELMWKWRFFYRDSLLLFELAPSLRPRLVALADKAQGEVKRVLDDMVKRGLLRGTEAQIQGLVVNSWIVAAYWIDYLTARHGITNVTKKHIEWGFAQMQALFEPYVVQPAA